MNPTTIARVIDRLRLKVGLHMHGVTLRRRCLLLSLLLVRLRQLVFAEEELIILLLFCVVWLRRKMVSA